ncbi:hypothetical protein NC652_036624 [Populus alba x Populus x berolinensis]|nr:hypothetical protein NC652_036624 [Populus alba x Populus x berolinensis]
MTDNNNNNPSFNSYNDDGEESSPLLKKNLDDNDKKPAKVSADAKTATATPASAGPEHGCTVNGLPLIYGSVMVASVTTMNSVAAILKSVSL